MAWDDGLHEKNFIENKERYEYGIFGYLRSTCLEIDKCSPAVSRKRSKTIWTNSHKYIAIAILKAEYMLKYLTAARCVNGPNFTAAISTVLFDRKPVPHKI